MKLLIFCLQIISSSCTYMYLSNEYGRSTPMFYKYIDQAYSNAEIISERQYKDEEQCIIKCHMTSCFAIDVQQLESEVKCSFFQEEQTLVASSGKWHISRKQPSSGYCERFDKVCGICDCHNTVESGRPYYCDCRPYQVESYETDCNNTVVYPFSKSAYYTIKPLNEVTMDVFCIVSVNDTSTLAMLRFRSNSLDLQNMIIGFGLSNDYWIGVKKLHMLTKHLPYTLVVDIWNDNYDHFSFEYRNFKIGTADLYTLTYDKYIELEGKVHMVMGNGDQLKLCEDGVSYWWGTCALSYNIFQKNTAHEPGTFYERIILTLRPEPEIKLLSENKKAVASSVWPVPAWLPEYAFDGNFNQHISGYSCYHSQWEVSPELKVDLGAIYNIYSVKLYMRTGCCPYTLTDLAIDTSYELEFNDSWLCIQSSAVTDPSLIETFYCEAKVKGQFVRIYDEKDTPTHLMICEMQVYGW